MMKRLDALMRFLGGPRFFFYAVFWLMVLVVMGTLAQGAIGLYQSQLRFFSSFIIWVGFIPLPGGYTTMGLVSLGLTLKLVLYSKWKLQNWGVNIVHFGALLLLFGGLLTAFFSDEGAMVIPEGETSNKVVDYHQFELAVVELSADDMAQVVAFSQGWLQKHKTIKDPSIPFTLEVEDFFKNSGFVKRTGDTSDYRGFAKQFKIVEQSYQKEEAKNRAGLIFEVKGATDEIDGRYAIFEDMPVLQKIRIQGKEYALILRKEERILPFSLQLNDFERLNYGRTEKAKSFRSTGTLIDGSIKQRYVIQMNEPLRYKDYTFFQASFVEGAQKESTVFAVVRNRGRLFPYISSLIMCFGLLFHLVIQLPKLLKGSQHAS